MKFPRGTALRRFVGAVACAGSGLCALVAPAHAATIYQQSFASGLGTFTSAGTVATSTAGAKMTAALLSTDGAITSAAISTVNYTNVTVSYDRVTVGLESTEGGIAEFSVNGGTTYSQLESTRDTASARVTFALPNTAWGQTNVRLRFRVSANSATETYTVNNCPSTARAGAPIRARRAPPARRPPSASS